MTKLSLTVALLGLTAAVSPVASLHATELKVLAGGAMTGVLGSSARNSSAPAGTSP